MITAHAGFSASPITNPNHELTEGLIDLPTSGVNIYADAVDSADPSAAFSFAWSILHPRTGQTASIPAPASASTTLDNIAAVWGDVRLFVVATNTSTGESSEADPRLAPASAFATLHIESESKALTLPAIGSREWWRSFDGLAQAVEDLELTDQALDSATINGAGDLILTLNDGTTINAGQARGADGADGADGSYIVSASVNGSGELLLTMSDGSTINAGTIPDNDTKRHIYSTGTISHYFDGTLHSGLNPNKRVWIAGPWIAHTDITLNLASITLYDGGPLNNQITFDITLTTAAAYALSGNTPPSAAASFTVTQPTAAEPLSATSSQLNLTVTTGTLFGLCMSAPSQGAAQGLNVNITATEL